MKALAANPAEPSAIVEEVGDLVGALRDAEPEHELEVYRGLGLNLTCAPETQTVRASEDLATHRWDFVGVRGATRTNAPPPMTIAKTLKLTQV
ncbi:hypothetical protein RMN56_22860 [Micromonospora halotolerans]|uniref:Uncharacterized protein n=1 Tax=Micromonospora halotolerans TaxID=709879 RepID=A0ABY9ZSG7_9ACTN|nr:hypothetical protein [Micromonospora halotolerans]WNM37960.1 hypothetical protein RMN56_22860 [Micromonospora halotolerans]